MFSTKNNPNVSLCAKVMEREVQGVVFDVTLQGYLVNTSEYST
jgi:hypothetical protein